MSFFERQLYQDRQQLSGGKLSSGHLTNDYFLVCIPEEVFLRDDCEDQVGSLVSQNGFLVWQAQTRDKSVVQRVSVRFDANIVQGWLQECDASHMDCLQPEASFHLTTLIDCSTRQIVQSSSLDKAPEYVALSYVWGEPSSSSDSDSEDEEPTPQVVEDALEVAKRLGYNYLWVDKYCVDQDDSSRKHEQIMNMDSIYENASLTIIAAAGIDQSRGLPGVSSDRRQKGIPLRHDNFSLSWIPPSPFAEILQSRWITRGWTYQEAILSRRRLVFTDSQVYLECRTRSYYECLQIPSQGTGSSISTFNRPRLFNLPHVSAAANKSTTTDDSRHSVHSQSDATVSKADTFNAYTQCAESYSERVLTFDSDSLNGFAGMIRRFESLKQSPVRHIWGIPFFDPRDDRLPDDVVDYAGFLLAGLSWKHDNELKPTRRRKSFPSWSWTGWEGSVTWPRVASTYDVQAPDLYTMASIQLSFKDGSILSIPDVRAKILTGDSLRQYPKALLIQTSAVPPSIFSSAVSSTKAAAKSQYAWFSSKASLGKAQMIEELQNGHLQALRLGIIGKTGFLLVVKKNKKTDSFHRVGLMHVPNALVTASPAYQDLQTYTLK